MGAPRILILGGTGMLGHKMFQLLRERFSGTFCTIRGEAHRPPLDRIELLQGDDVISSGDMTDFPRLAAILAALRPQYVINCVGVIRHRAEAVYPIPCIAINSLLPHRLAKLVSCWG